MTTSPRRPSPASRATRRSRRPAQRNAGFLERYRNRLIAIGAVLVFAILVGAAFLNSAGPAYACTTLFDPTPAPSFVAPTVEPGTTNPPVTAPPPGFVQPDMGHLHVAPGTKVTYANCPPASGKHYIGTGIGPINGGLYGPNDGTIPEGWVHNLEHGAIVLLYRCQGGTGPGCTDAGQQEMRALLAEWPNSPICNIPPGKALTPVITRFDDMAWPYAAVVWDVVLPMQTLDKDALFSFYAQRGEQYNQEKQCAAPTPTPGPTPTEGPTAAPTTSPAASPAASPAPSPAPSPAASTAPAAS